MAEHSLDEENVECSRPTSSQSRLPSHFISTAGRFYSFPPCEVVGSFPCSRSRPANESRRSRPVQTTSTGSRNCGLKPAAIKNFTGRRKTGSNSVSESQCVHGTSSRDCIEVARRRSSYSTEVVRKQPRCVLYSAGNGAKRRGADPSTDVVARTTSHWRRLCGRSPLDGSSGGQSAPSRMRQAGAACGGVWLPQLQRRGYNRRSRPTGTVPQSASLISIHRIHERVRTLDCFD